MRYVVLVASALLFVLSGYLAWSVEDAKHEARVSVVRSLEAARDSVARGVADEIERLRTGRAESATTYSVAGAELPPASLTAPGVLRVAVRDGDGQRVAEGSLGSLPSDVMTAHGVERVTLGYRDGRVVLDLLRNPPKQVPYPPSEAWRTAIEGDSKGKTWSVPAGQIPPGHQFEDDLKAYGCWGKVPAVQDLLVLVEMTDEAAVGDAAGVRPAAFGYRSPVGLHVWHFTVGVAVFALVIGVFLFVSQKKGGTGVLMRTWGFAVPRIGVIAVVVGLGFLVSLRRLVWIALIKTLPDEVLGNPGPNAGDQLLMMAIGLALFGVFLGVIGFFKEYLQGAVSIEIVADIRKALGRKVASLPLSFFHKIQAGDVLARLEKDVASMRQILSQVFKNFFVEPFVMAGAVFAAFVLNWQLALIMFGIPFVVLPLFKIAKRIKKRSGKRQKLMAEVSHVIFQMLTGIKVVKAFGGEEQEAERLDGAIGRLVREAKRITKLGALSESTLDTLQLMGAAIVLLGGGYLVIGGDVTLGDLMAFMIIIQTMYGSSKKLTSTANKLVGGIPGAERVFEVLDAKNDLVVGDGDLPGGALTQGIELRGVRFAYGEKTILDGIDLVVPAGQVVALVGPTGAGKTTICDLVAHFYDVGEGAVLYDGVDVREVSLESLSRKLAIVTQGAFLFNTTIRENILYGALDSTQEQVEAAARDAFVHDEILAMEGGYGKLAGEGGSQLSGGQRQRVTIARALLKDAPVLILDEATSALDSHAESQVQAALGRLTAGRTVIVVAHRLSTIRNADKVVVLERGRIVEQGRPSDLMEREDSRFRAMVQRQDGGWLDEDMDSTGTFEVPELPGESDGDD